MNIYTFFLQRDKSQRKTGKVRNHPEKPDPSCELHSLVGQCRRLDTATIDKTCKDQNHCWVVFEQIIPFNRTSCLCGAESALNRKWDTDLMESTAVESATARIKYILLSSQSDWLTFRIHVALSSAADPSRTLRDFPGFLPCVHGNVHLCTSLS